jgi:hypothetical protein
MNLTGEWMVCDLVANYGQMWPDVASSVDLSLEGATKFIILAV